MVFPLETGVLKPLKKIIFTGCKYLIFYIIPQQLPWNCIVYQA